MGRRFIASSPTAAEISAVTERPAQNPVRVYVGLGSRNTAQARARLALEELKRQHGFDRKILIGVFEQNVRLNNYFDGPFDQLPDNFIEGETLRQAIIDSDPAVKGKIDRLGYFQTDDSRYAISPYMQYRSENDLLQVHRCATDRRVPAAAYYRCFVMDEDGPRTVGRPLALQELRGKAR